MTLDIERIFRIIILFMLAIFVFVFGSKIIKSGLHSISSDQTAIVINIDESKDLSRISNTKSSLYFNRGFKNMNDYDVVYIWGILNIQSNTISVTLLDDYNQKYKIDIESQDCEIFYDAESHNTNTPYIVVKANKHIGWDDIDNELKNISLFTVEIHFTTKYLSVSNI